MAIIVTPAAESGMTAVEGLSTWHLALIRDTEQR